MPPPKTAAAAAPAWNHARLRGLIEATGLSERELAAKLGMGHSDLSSILRGDVRDPRISTVLKIADAAGLSRLKLFDLEP